MAHLNTEIGVMLGRRPDGEQQMTRIAGGQLASIDPALQNGGLFIDKLPQLGLQEIADMRRSS